MAAWNEEQSKFNNLEQAVPICKSLGITPPAYIEGEPLTHQRKRVIEKLRPFVSDDLQRVQKDEIFGSALDHYEKKFMESAAQEAVRPTKIPEGELKEVTRYDATGRPSYEFFGSPSAWLNNFAPPPKRLAAINASAGNFQKV